MFDFVSFIPRAIVQGIPLLFGSTGETLTEKSGNLNLGIPGISTHSFRKFYATEIYKNSNYNIALVQQLLQHSSAAVTQRYIGIQQQEIERAIEGHLRLDV